MAGPALSLRARSQALHQDLDGLAPTTGTVQVGANWSVFTDALVDYSGAGPNLTGRQLTQATDEIRASLAATPLPLGGGAWTGLSTNLFVVGSGAAPSAFAQRGEGAAPPQLEVLYRDPLPANAALVAGSYAGPPSPAGTLSVAASAQTAARYGLHPGSRLTLATHAAGTVTLVVTAIVTERGSGSSFWTQEPLASAPSLMPGENPYWVGAVFADPGQLAAMQSVFGNGGLELSWEFPLAVGSLNADQAQGLADGLNRAATTTPALTGPLEAGADTLTVSSPLASDLSAFLTTQAATQAVLSLLFVSLIVTGAAVILLAARLIVLRRDGELAMLRARGGSLAQVAAVTARGTLVAVVPAAVIGAGLAVIVVPGYAVSSTLGWWLAGITVAVALAGSPLIAAWLYRKPAPAANPALRTSADTSRRRVSWRRLVAEVTACAAAVAALVVLHDEGQSAGSGGQVNLYLAATPILVAVLVVVVMLRLYPLAIRGLAALSARGAGATGFLALSRAARTSLTGVLPAFALVLALSLATFAGMTTDSIVRGETAASWRATGADVLIDAGPVSGPVTPVALRAIAAVGGVRQVTAVWSTAWLTASGQPVTIIGVDPASYAALVAGTPFPPFPAAAVAALAAGRSSPAAALRVLASPAAAAILGAAPTQLTSPSPLGPVTVRIAGTLGATPAQPAGGAFLVMPMQALPGPVGQPAPNVVLVNGSGIDQPRLAAAARRVIPGSTVTFRSAVLSSLASSPLQHGASQIAATAIAAAAGLGLFIVILGLALGSAERELTLARLSVMGHQRAVRLVMAEAMPAVLAAVIAGAACAVALPYLIGSSIDLSAFTRNGIPVRFQPDLPALAWPAAAIVLLAAGVLAAQTRALRRHGVTGLIRAH
jgi:putative ABC transport system permease protein